MNPPQVYMCSPSRTLLLPHTIPLGRPSAPAPSIRYRASNLDWRLVSYRILYMFQCHSPKSSHPLWGRLSYLSLLFFGILHSNGYTFPFLLCFSLLFFSQLCKASSDNHFAFFHFFFLGMVLVTASYTMYKPLPTVLQALCLSDLIHWIYLSLPLYNHKWFDLGHT